jgi:hypothetical protein
MAAIILAASTNSGAREMVSGMIQSHLVHMAGIAAATQDAKHDSAEARVLAAHSVDVRNRIDSIKRAIGSITPVTDYMKQQGADKNLQYRGMMEALATETNRLRDAVDRTATMSKRVNDTLEKWAAATAPAGAVPTPGP